ncbi:hypothetical protein DENSPDRAFT_148413 [Dentipellis sp. KUC8613]|nr:hypothetical protein DENSPDRAFT_148413 [Dentipellis sp. KUC8613]
MTLTILASFSLLALVVTARPIVPQDNSEFAYARPSDVQSAVQALFESRTKQSALDSLDGLEGDVAIHITSPKQQHMYLSQLDTDDVKALIPLGENGLLSEDEKKLYEMLGGSNRMDDVEGESRPLAEDETSVASGSPESAAELSLVGEDVTPLAEPEAVTSGSAPWYTLPSQPLIIIAFSCALALMTVFCVGVSLYVYYYIRSEILSSRTAWDLLPKLERQGLGARSRSPNVATQEKMPVEGEKSLTIFQTLSRMVSKEELRRPEVYENEKVGILIDLDDTNAASDDEYLDAIDISITAPPNLPSSSPINPLLVPLPSSPSLSPLRKPLQMRETTGSSPRPAWSVQASRPSSPEPSSRNDVQMAEQPPRARALDFALAMQLWPGGVGADPAFLVRFLMAVFGWVAVLLGGTARTEGRNVRLHSLVGQ